MSWSAQGIQARLRGGSGRRPRTGRAVRLVLLPATAALLLYLAWPYATLWRLDRAVASDDPGALAQLVDLEAVRAEIKKKLNKDANSEIVELSDAFISWLEAGIQTAGSGAVDRLVTLDWVRGQLRGPEGEDCLWARIIYAFFDAPDGFRVVLGTPASTSVQARLTLRHFSWRITSVYY